MGTKQKKIAVLISGSAALNGKATEAMRMAVGLTLRNPGVRLFLLDEGTKFLETKDLSSGLQAAFVEHLNAFLDLGCPVVVEEKNGGSPKHLLENSGMEARSREDIIRFLTDSDVVILLEEPSPGARLQKEPDGLAQREMTP